ncbi:MAG: MFS transporter [Clostridiales bacterium]
MQKQFIKFQKWLILFVMTLSVFMATLDGSIVNIALPVISKELNVSISSIQWIVTSYFLVISISLLIWGKLSDVYGKKKIFTLGFVTFTIGSALCGISTDLKFLVLSRIIQGIGASSMMALSQGIVTEIFPSKERGKALGIIGTTVSIGSLVGPSLGGVLIYTFSWKYIFFINIPIGIIGMILSIIILPKIQTVPKSKPFDFIGTFLFNTSILLLFLSLLFIQEGTISTSLFIIMILLSVVTMILFLKYEKVRENALINLQLFKIKEFSLGLSSAYMAFISISSILLFIPFYLQFVLNLNTIKAGILISFFPITSAIVAPISGWLSDKLTYKPLTLIGLSINTITLIFISFLNANTKLFVIAILMSLLGAGNSMFQSPNTSSIMGSVPKKHLGIAGGTNALSRNLGLVSGTTFSVLIFSLVTKMNINSLSSSATLTNSSLFLKGYKFVILSTVIFTIAALLINLKRIEKSS